MKVVIIGGGAAGTTAAFHIRGLNEDAEITIISNEPYTHYSPCGIPYVLSGYIKEMEDLIVYPPSLYKMMNITLHLNEEAEEIEDGIVRTRKGNEFKYDTLLLATGSVAILPSIEIENKKRIFTLKNLDDGKRILSCINEGVKEALIIGAGPLGIEVADAFIKRGIEVFLVEKEKHVLSSFLDEDMAEELKERMEEKGVKLYLGEQIERIEGERRKVVYTQNGERIECDFVLFACGVRANVTIAEKSSIKIGESGAVEVDEYGRTNKEHVFAAGECAQGIDFINGKPTFPKLGAVATLQGKVVAENILGRRRKLPPILHAFLSEVFDIQIASIGAKEEEGMSVGRFEGGVKDSFYPDRKRIKIKVLSKNGRLFGAQMLGDEVFPRALLLLFAMQAKVDIDALSFYQTLYVPSICATFEPVLLAVSGAKRYA